MQLYRQLRYQVTHHRISLKVYSGDLGTAANVRLLENSQILSLANISSLPMGSAQKKILKALTETEQLS